MLDFNAEEITVVNLLFRNFSKEKEPVITSDNVSYGELTDISSNGNEIFEKVIWKMELICPTFLKTTVGSHLTDFIRRKCSQLITTRSFEEVESEIEGLNSSWNVFDSVDVKKRTTSIEVIFKASLVYAKYLQQQKTGRDTLAETLPTSYSSYPVFKSVYESLDDSEMQYLLIYRAMMQTALEVIPARRNKMLIISICALLEGSGRTYITGGTQSAATTRRMIIFEHESGLKRAIHQLQDETEIDPRKAITCTCGANILKRTMWKHSSSMKHKKLTLLKLPKA